MFTFLNGVSQCDLQKGRHRHTYFIVSDTGLHTSCFSIAKNKGKSDYWLYVVVLKAPHFKAVYQLDKNSSLTCHSLMYNQHHPSICMKTFHRPKLQPREGFTSVNSGRLMCPLPSTTYSNANLCYMNLMWSLYQCYSMLSHLRID